MQVAMTYAARIHADLDFTTLGWQDFDLFETEWSPCLIEHCCLRLHSALLLYLLWYHSGTTVTAHVSNVCGQQNLTRHGIIADKDRTCPYSTSGTTVLLRPPYAGASSLMEFLDLRTSLKNRLENQRLSFAKLVSFRDSRG